ncbi:MAG: rod shape-determining protein MreC, partial [Clostridiales bacterium]|nr:rod shape-determining protein MreC [Clostridiales bacterium]
MIEFFRSRKFKVLIAVFLTVFVASIIAANTKNNSSVVSSALGTIFAPVQRLSAIVSEKFDRFSGGFVSSGTYRAKVEELEQEIDNYRQQMVDYEELKSENELYEEFLGVKEENPDYILCIANVISRDSSDMFYSFTINKGSKKGVRVNDPVISGKYLVGIVTSVMPTQSVVRTILDPKVNIGAYEIRTREDGYVTSTAQLSQKGFCKLSNISNTTAIATGGIVCTSGIGGVYPKDLIIGTVTQVLDDEYDISAYAQIKPGIDIPKLDAVAVITEF